MSATIRVVIIEDQWMVRDGLAAITNVADGIEVVGTGSDGLEAIELVDELAPDVVLMDIRMPNLGGIEATRQIKAAHPKVEILMLTTFVETGLIAEALAAGAAGYLTKDIEPDDLSDAIATAARGMVQLTPAVAARLASASARGRQGEVGLEAVSQLTPRERDVLRMLGTGASNSEIAAELYLSVGTVKNHVSSILRQLGLADRTAAAIVATKLDLS